MCVMRQCRRSGPVAVRQHTLAVNHCVLCITSQQRTGAITYLQFGSNFGWQAEPARQAGHTRCPRQVWTRIDR